MPCQEQGKTCLEGVPQNPIQLVVYYMVQLVVNIELYFCFHRISWMLVWLNEISV